MDGGAALHVSWQRRGPDGAETLKLERVVEVPGRDLLPAVPVRKDGGRVDQVGQLGAGEPLALVGNLAQVDALLRRLVLKVHLLREACWSAAPSTGGAAQQEWCIDDVCDAHLEDVHAAVQVRQPHSDDTIESTRPDQGRVQDVPTVGGTHDDDARVVIEPVHQRQKLVQRLVALVGPPAAVATGAPDGVDLVDEDDGRGHLLGLGE